MHKIQPNFLADISSLYIISETYDIFYHISYDMASKFKQNVYFCHVVFHGRIVDHSSAFLHLLQNCPNNEKKSPIKTKLKIDPII